MIYMKLPSVPPSMNQMYIATRGGKRALSPEGTRYKKETKTHLTRTYPAALRDLKQNCPWLLIVHFVFPEDVLLNAGYPTKTKNRYKKFDVSNRVKILEDALAEATAVDDCHHWVVLVRKAVGTAPATHIWMQNLEHEPASAITNFLDTILSMAEDE